MIKPNYNYSNRLKIASDDPNEVGYNQTGLAYILYWRLMAHSTNRLLLVTSKNRDELSKIVDMIRRHDYAAIENMY